METYYIFYHVYLFGNWKSILKEQLQLLEDSGLLEFSKIRVGIVYYNETENDIDECKKIVTSFKNVKVLFVKHTSSCAESDTLQELYNFCQSSSENLKIFYFHTKGVTHYKSEREENVKDWRNIMEYFLIEKWRLCVEKLNEDYDCCGINYQNHAANIKNQTVAIKIFNGNFFWANSDYIKKLDTTILWEHRYSSENWILSKPHRAYVPFTPPPSFDYYHYKLENYRNL